MYTRWWEEIRIKIVIVNHVLYMYCPDWEIQCISIDIVLTILSRLRLYQLCYPDWETQCIPINIVLTVLS